MYNMYGNTYRIKGLENALKERETDYGILEDKYSKIVKKEDQGPVVFIGNIISKYHKLCSNNSPDPYFWTRLWFTDKTKLYMITKKLSKFKIHDFDIVNASNK